MNLLAHHATDQELTDLWWASMEALEVLGIGWLVCDSGGRLLGTNQVARRVLQAGDGLKLKSECVSCAIPACAELLAEALRRAAGATASVEKSDGFAVIVRRVSGKRALTLSVHPVGAMSTAENGALSAAIVLILDPSLRAQPTESDLRQLYGFTTREARLATLLMDGSTLSESCCELGISRSTGRTHLERLFKKTGVRRQCHLVSILLKTIGLIRLRHKDAMLAIPASRGLLDQAVRANLPTGEGVSGSVRPMDSSPLRYSTQKAGNHYRSS
jgi:DNA-binding CsgD family transcriptional regulator